MRRPRWTEPKTIHRWLTKRCEHCGHRFRWSRDARHATGNRDGKVYHGTCMSYLHWRRVAEERLDMVALTCEIAGLTGRDVQGVVEIRTTGTTDPSTDRDKAWRVFYDLEKRTEKETTT